MVQYNFNAQTVAPSYGSAGGLPTNPDGSAAWYKVVMLSSDAKNNSKGTGGFIELTLACIDGPQKGITQTDRLNLHHPNPQVVEIANKQLSAYCHVTGKYMISDTAELHNIPFQIQVGQQKNDPQYTEIKKLADINGNEPGKTGAGPQQQAPQAPQGPAPAGVAPAAAGPAPGWAAPAGQPAAPVQQPQVQPAGYAPMPPQQQQQPPAQQWQQPPQPQPAQAAPQSQPAPQWAAPAAQPQPAPAPAQGPPQGWVAPGGGAPAWPGAPQQ